MFSFSTRCWYFVVFSLYIISFYFFFWQSWWRQQWRTNRRFSSGWSVGCLSWTSSAEQRRSTSVVDRPSPTESTGSTRASGEAWPSSTISRWRVHHHLSSSGCLRQERNSLHELSSAVRSSRISQKDDSNDFLRWPHNRLPNSSQGSRGTCICSNDNFSKRSTSNVLLEAFVWSSLPLSARPSTKNRQF